MDKKIDSLVPLKEVISNIFSQSGLPFNPADGLIWKVWEEVVGNAIASNAQPLWIKNRTLRVRVADPIWLQELRFLEEAIRAKLNRALGREAVKKIDFRHGSARPQGS